MTMATPPHSESPQSEEQQPQAPPPKSRNARAQARHRAKRKAYIEQLEETVTKLQAALCLSPEQAAALPAPQIKIRELEAENTRLRRELDAMRLKMDALSAALANYSPTARSHSSVPSSTARRRTPDSAESSDYGYIGDRDLKKRKLSGDERALFLGSTSAPQAQGVGGLASRAHLSPQPQYGQSPPPLDVQSATGANPQPLYPLHSAMFLPSQPSPSPLPSPPYSAHPQHGQGNQPSTSYAHQQQTLPRLAHVMQSSYNQESPQYATFPPKQEPDSYLVGGAAQSYQLAYNVSELNQNMNSTPLSHSTFGGGPSGGPGGGGNNHGNGFASAWSPSPLYSMERQRPAPLQ